MLGDLSTLNYVYNFHSNHCVFSKEKKKGKVYWKHNSAARSYTEDILSTGSPTTSANLAFTGPFGPNLSSLESIGGRYYKISYHSICVNLTFAGLPSSPSSASRPNNPPPPGVNHLQWIMALLHHKRLCCLRLLPLQHRAFQFRS
jgi:hypothetical protein